MLADDYIASLKTFGASVGRRDPRLLEMFRQEAALSGLKTPDERLAMIEHGLAFESSMQTAQRFVLSPMVVEAADEFADSQKVVKTSLDYIFMPAETTWIEWRDGRSGDRTKHRHGLFLIGYGEGKAKLSVGYGAYVTDKGNGDVTNIPISFDLHEYVFRPIHHRATPEEAAEQARLGRFLVCALALVNTPRVSLVVRHEIDAKLNRARDKRGKPALLSWNDVTIRPDIGWMRNVTHEEGLSGERRRHHVRTFLRLKMGHVELVKPHWRGNREKGYVLHRHVVRMEDEEAGAWKGEPLPGPSIIRLGQEIDVGDED